MKFHVDTKKKITTYSDLMPLHEFMKMMESVIYKHDDYKYLRLKTKAEIEKTL